VTHEEFQALKEQLKAELLDEMRSNDEPISTRPWHEVRGRFIARLDRYSARERYQILNAVSAVVRSALKVRSVLGLSASQAVVAERIANALIDVLDEFSERGKAAQP